MAATAYLVGYLYRIGDNTAVQLKDGGVLSVKKDGNTHCERIRYDSVHDWSKTLDVDLSTTEVTISLPSRMSKRPENDFTLIRDLLRSYKLHIGKFAFTMSLKEMRNYLRYKNATGLYTKKLESIENDIRNSTDPNAQQISVQRKQTLFVLDRETKNIYPLSVDETYTQFHLNGKVGKTLRSVGVSYTDGDPDLWVYTDKGIIKHSWT